tara:strand:- start:303 stop:1451 length:1149 start_codon:yes stop_codon:yes gene_type:complete
MTTLTHADKVNRQYNQTQSNFVTLQDRLNESLALNPVFKNMLIGVVDEFKRRNKQWKKLSDIALCTSVDATLDQILIDTTMQRQLNFRHIVNILSAFKNTMVMPIQVYVDPKHPDKYIAWDGQHTAVALYIIATKVFGVRTAQMMVPVVVYPTAEKLEIRRNFILLNGDAKEPLDFIDTYKQMVFGVRVDGADDDAWIKANQKQVFFEQAGLFATNSKFGDETEPGAFTLLADTLMTKNLAKAKDPVVTKYFAGYWSMLNAERPVQAKEARQLYEYFDACHQQGITVDTDYIRELVGFTKDFFEADFSETGSFWDKVKMSYTRWYQSANPESYAEHGLKGFATEWRCGGPFLIAQIKKSTNLKTPKYDPNNGYTVKAEDLWD